MADRGAPRFPQGSYIGAVSRSADHLDIFGTDTGGQDPHGRLGAGLRRRLARLVADQGRSGAAGRSGDRRVAQRRTSSTSSWSAPTTRIYTAAWEPAFADGWHGWWNLNGGKAAHGSYIHGVSRRANFLDVFVVGLDGRVYTARMEPRPHLGRLVADGPLT